MSLITSCIQCLLLWHLQGIQYALAQTQIKLIFFSFSLVILRPQTSFFQLKWTYIWNARSSAAILKRLETGQHSGNSGNSLSWVTMWCKHRLVSNRANRPPDDHYMIVIPRTYLYFKMAANVLWVGTIVFFYILLCFVRTKWTFPSSLMRTLMLKSGWIRRSESAMIERLLT